MGLKMDKPKAVAACLLAEYRGWAVNSFKGEEPRLTSIDPDMGSIGQLIQDDPAGRFEELVGRVSHISKEKLDHDKVILYRTAIVAEMKHQGVEVTEMNAVHLAAILCAGVPTDPVPY